MPYLLDTNIVSDLVRRPRSTPVHRRIRQVGENNVYTSIIVAAEIRYGVRKAGGVKLASQAQAVLERLPVLPFEEPADVIYGEIRAELERQGQPISDHDYLIAAHALASGHTLITANEREFSRIAELACENWLTA